MLLQICLTFFSCKKQKVDILKNVVNKTSLVTIDFHYMDKKSRHFSKDIPQRKKVKQVWNDTRVVNNVRIYIFLSALLLDYMI